MAQEVKIKEPCPKFKVEEAAHIETLLASLREFLVTNDLDIKVRLRPKAAFAFHCGAYGPGLEGGEVDIPTNFTIQAKDNNDRNLTHGDTPFKVSITTDGKHSVPTTITDKKDGTYTVDYTPEHAGKHTISVSLDGKEIKGSPFSPVIDPPTPDPSKCTADGPGTKGATVAVPAPITIQARNRIGNPLKIGGHPFSLEVAGPHNDNAPSTLKDNKDGTYSGEYTPIHPGPHVVNVTLGDNKDSKRHIKDSPFKIQTDKNAALADAGKSTAFGPGVEGGCTTAEPAVFTVQAVGPTGEKLTKGGSPFDVEVKDAEDNLVPVTLKDNGDGTYSGSYQPTKPEKYTVDVVLRHPDQPLYYEHIVKSPFHPQILPGIYASKCTCHGPGVQRDNPLVVDTFPAQFVIQANDITGKPWKKGGDPFQVQVKGPKNKECDVKINDKEDGTYDVEYIPEDHGEHTVEVTLLGKPVGSSPYSVLVKAGFNPESSQVVQLSFVVRAKGKDAQPLKVGGEASALRAAVLQRKGAADFEEVKEGEPVKITDNGDGSYLVTYTLPLLMEGVRDAARDYMVTCTVNGNHIQGSPFKLAMPR